MDTTSLIIKKASLRDAGTILKLMEKQAEDEKKFIHFNKNMCKLIKQKDPKLIDVVFGS